MRHPVYAAPRILLGSVFLLSAAHKLRDPGAMVKIIGSLPWLPSLPDWLTASVGGGLAGWEAFLGLWCMRISKAMWPAAVATWATLAIFTIAVAPIFAITGGSCGCAWEWMPIQAYSTAGLLARNIALGLLALGCVLGDRLRRVPEIAPRTS